MKKIRLVARRRRTRRVARRRCQGQDEAPSRTVDPQVAAEKMDKGEASYRFMRDALPLALPSWSLPIYFSMKSRKARLFTSP